jgi:hypothetical protein
LLLGAQPALAGQSTKKAIWGPGRVDGVSQFPIYRDLGAGIYELTLRWASVAPTKPAHAADPADPAYAWPEDVDFARAEGRKYGIRVAIQLTTAPRWANGGHAEEWAPRRAADFAAFARAAAKRYPDVKLWMIWGEPSRHENFMPLVHERRDHPLSPRQARAPQLYARILDASYAALKSVSRRNLVIGGNTFTTGDISPYNFIRNMRLPNGRPPRMDMYGHNPFTARRPDLGKHALGHGFADFSDLRRLASWVDAGLGRGRRPIRLFLSEFFAPTDHANHEFNFHVTRRTQADWVSAALGIVRRWSRIYTLGWFSLYDDPPRRAGDEVNRGLLDWRGRKKASYFAFRSG